MAKKDTEWTTRRLEQALEERYPHNEGYALFFEVADATGYSARRTADAVMYGLWKNRGLHFTGFEIKSQRSDWLRELRQPTKAESIMKYCQYWYLVSGPDVVNLETDTIPEPWGVLIGGTTGKLREVKKPAQMTAEAPTPGFIASVMRAALKKRKETEWIPVEDVEEEIIKRADAKISRELNSLKAAHEGAQRIIKDQDSKIEEYGKLKKELEKTFGFSLPRADYSWDRDPFLKILRLLQTHGAENTISKLALLADQTKNTLGQLSAMLGSIEEDMDEKEQ